MHRCKTGIMDMNTQATSNGAGAANGSGRILMVDDDPGILFCSDLMGADDAGTPNPLAGRVRHSIARGNSQSGNFLRGWLHLGFNQDEAGQQVHEGLWPIIAGRRIALNFRWAQPDGVLELYQAGSEGPQWWGPYPDHARKLPTRSIQDRCMATKTCPKIIEHFGAAEIWALKLGPEWVGTDALQDIPLVVNALQNVALLHGTLGDQPRDPHEGPHVLLRRRRVHHDETVTRSINAQVATEAGVAGRRRDGLHRRLHGARRRDPVRLADAGVSGPRAAGGVISP